MSAANPGAVLFACNMNSIRSPMAAGLARKNFGKYAHFESCGVMAGYADPFAQQVMEEIGVDLSSHETKSFADLHEANFDLIVALTEEAYLRAREIARQYSVDVEYWPMFDPTAESGPRDQRLTAFRQLRDELDRRIAARFASLSTKRG